MICENCGKEFDLELDKEEFESETLKDYNYLRRTLCAECAKDVIFSEIDGEYTEICDRCGKEFDPFIDDSKFMDYASSRADTNYYDESEGGTICFECTVEKFDQELEELEKEMKEYGVW